jgi:two-component system, chemotaxis family, CheB/CheR fusion protein
MARAGLAFELRNAIHKCGKSRSVIKKSGIEIRTKGQIRNVSIEVSLLQSHPDEKAFLVVFEDDISNGRPEKTSLSRDKIVKQLEQEIEVLREDMRSMLEGQEAHVEELQSANEEIVSSNEELQSINEELETSKEELESANEELTTINNELQVRNEQLSDSQEYAAAVFDSIREAVIILDVNFRVKSANKAFYRIFKENEESIHDVLLFELGNHQWDIHQLRRMLDHIVASGASFTDFEVEHDFPNIGHKVMLLNGKTVYHTNNNQQLVLLAIEDITEHRQAEKLMSEREFWFRNMANQAPVMIWVAGKDKRKNFFNDTWLEFTGRKLSELQGFGWRDDIHPDDASTYMGIYDDHFNKQLSFAIEYRLKRADGNYRWIVDTAKPTYLADGSFSGFIGSCSEIHDKKMIHEELEQRVRQRTQDLQHINMELQRSNNELQQFAYVASHDLQEPLRKILTFADRLQKFDTIPSSGVSFVEKIVESSKRMRKLIDELLNFSRTSRAEQKYEKLNLEDVLQTVLDDFELIISEKNAVIEHDRLPAIDGIPLQMEQLLHNLVGNALKFTKRNGTPILKIKYRSADETVLVANGLDPAIPHFEITFSDNGIGFAPEYADQIFDIFQRLNYKQDYPGTGIGLALCRKIVNNHRGKIFAEGVENEGAVFRVILPAKQIEQFSE